MKLNFLNARTINISISVLIILFIVLIALSVLPFMTRTGSLVSSADINTTTYSVDNQLEPIDPIVPDSISHRQYSQFADRIRQNRRMKNGMLNHSSSFFFIGVTTLSRCEHCSVFDNRPKIKEQFISLLWWTLDTVSKSSPTQYYVKDGHPYLRKDVCKQGRSFNKNNETYDCKQVDIAVPFRYDTNTKSMLIPTSEGTANLLNIVFLILGVLLVLYFLYYIVGGFIKFLLEIAAGTPFSDKNVSRLKRITLTLLLIPLIVFVLNLVMRVVFYKYFTEDIKLSESGWSVSWKLVILSAIFAALYLAFKQGKKLKEEQNLTI